MNNINFQGTLELASLLRTLLCSLFPTNSKSPTGHISSIWRHRQTTLPLLVENTNLERFHFQWYSLWMLPLTLVSEHGVWEFENRLKDLKLKNLLSQMPTAGHRVGRQLDKTSDIFKQQTKVVHGIWFGTRESGIKICYCCHSIQHTIFGINLYRYQPIYNYNSWIPVDAATTVALPVPANMTGTIFQVLSPEYPESISEMRSSFTITITSKQ